MLEKIFFCTFLLKGEVGKSTFLAKKNYSEKIPEFFANELRRVQG